MLKLQCQLITQIAPTQSPRRPPSTAASHIEHLAQQIAEYVPQVALKSSASERISTAAS